MSRPIAMARFDLGWPMAGTVATVVSALTLGVLALGEGLPFWMPLNATTHALHGAEAARTTALDLGHTGLGALIHVAACFFWALVAVMLIRWAPRGPVWLAWFVGLATAAIAGLVDYGLLPRALRPGWELVLPPWCVVAGFVALGIGLALGLTLARSDSGPAVRRPGSVPVPPDPRRRETAPAPGSALDHLRQPSPDELDQRQQRIDPADRVTEDPNRLGNGNKQPGRADADERPDA